MNVETRAVILKRSPCGGGLVEALHLYHRTMPELWTEGDSAAEAAEQLVSLLIREMDSVASRRHRDALRHAIADVRAFAAAQVEPEPDTGPGPRALSHIR